MMLNQKLSRFLITIGLVSILLINLTNKSKSQTLNLEAIIAPNAEVEKVAAGFKFIEGPVWHPDGFLLFSDLPANTIYQWQPNGKTGIFRQPSGKANGNALDNSGHLITAEHENRRLSLTEKDGQIVTLVSHYRGKRLNSQERFGSKE